MGLVVNPMVPWLGFSPDGIVFKHGKPTILLEIKRPVRGRTEKISDLVKAKKVSDIVSEDENYALRSTYCYYSQVQLGLFLRDLKDVHVVYSEVESLVIPVRRCMTSIDSLVRRLQYVYFTHYLPELIKYVMWETP